MPGRGLEKLFLPLHFYFLYKNRPCPREKTADLKFRIRGFSKPGQGMQELQKAFSALCVFFDNYHLNRTVL